MFYFPESLALCLVFFFVCIPLTGTQASPCTASGKPCKVPFIYRDVENTKCSKQNSPGILWNHKPWCSTETDSDGNFIDDKWENIKAMQGPFMNGF